MKSIINFLIIGVVAIQIVSCGNNDDSAKETEEEVFINKLANTWMVNTVDIDGEDVTGAFESLQLTFGKDKSITVVNPVDPVWPSSGTFELVKAGDTFSIDRSDGMLITVIELTDTSLIMNFQYNSGSRLAGVSGGYTFEMSL